MHSVLLHLRRSDHQHRQIRRLYDAVASLKCVRDRGLDHAVEKEKGLMPLVNLKNLILSEPSKSLPLPLITQSKESLRLPLRPIEFIRRHPSVFEEFLPGGIGVQPHIKLTPDALSLHEEENLVYESVIYKQDAADRLSKLLMVSRVNKIPVRVINWLTWELGLPTDYLETIVPEFPDCFRLSNDLGGDVLELVCWSDELAVSQIEKKFGVKKFGEVLELVSKKKKTEDMFPLKYSTGFEMDRKYQKWVDEWQKLPYISPYENASHLPSKSDESDKWVVGVLHELLNLFVGKKAEREVVFAFGEWLGLRSRFKMALLQHPGIFYLSNKIRTHTVILRDGYSRGMLVVRHPLMDMRFKYVQLMSANAAVKGDSGAKTALKKSPKEPGVEVHNEEEQGELSESHVDYDDEEEEEDDDDNELSEKMDSTRRGTSPNKRFKGRDSHRDYEDSDGDNEHAGRRDPRNRGVSPNRRFRGRESQRTYADLDGGNEPGRRMKLRNSGPSPNRRFQERESQRTSEDLDGEPSRRMISRNRGASPNRRFQERRESQRTSEDLDGEPGRRMISRNREASPNRRFQERKSQRISEDLDGEPGRRMISRNGGASPNRRFKERDSPRTPNKRFEGRESQRKSSGGQGKRNSSGGGKTRFNLLTEKSM